MLQSLLNLGTWHQERSWIHESDGIDSRLERREEEARSTTLRTAPLFRRAVYLRPALGPPLLQQ